MTHSAGWRSWHEPWAEDNVYIMYMYIINNLGSRVQGSIIYLHFFMRPISTACLDTSCQEERIRVYSVVCKLLTLSATGLALHHGIGSEAACWAAGRSEYIDSRALWLWQLASLNAGEWLGCFSQQYCSLCRVCRWLSNLPLQLGCDYQWWSHLPSGLSLCLSSFFPNTATISPPLWQLLH